MILARPQIIADAGALADRPARERTSNAAQWPLPLWVVSPTWTRDLALYGLVRGRGAQPASARQAVGRALLRGLRSFLAHPALSRIFELSDLVFQFVDHR